MMTWTCLHSLMYPIYTTINTVPTGCTNVYTMWRCIQSPRDVSSSTLKDNDLYIIHWCIQSTPDITCCLHMPMCIQSPPDVSQCLHTQIYPVYKRMYPVFTWCIHSTQPMIPPLMYHLFTCWCIQSYTMMNTVSNLHLMDIYINSTKYKMIYPIHLIDIQ